MVRCLGSMTIDAGSYSRQELKNAAPVDATKSLRKRPFPSFVRKQAKCVLESAAMHRQCSSRFEREARKCGWQRIAGLDEAGRGSLFGPVVAAAVILDPKRRIVGLDDSKKLPAERREVLALRIREYALAWAVAEVDARRIDAWNIYQASRQAMAEAVRQLKIAPDYLLLDAMQLDVLIEQKSLIHGDALSISIAAASIIAKVERDRRMIEWDGIY